MGCEAMDAIPTELRTRPQWVGWRLVTRDGKPTKVPVNPATGGNADSTNPTSWGTFGEAVAGVVAERWDGIGFVFTADDPYCGIDLDDVINTDTGEVDADAEAWVERFATYAEVSPSGRGIHLICRASLAHLKGRKRGDRECYDRSRFFTMTGRRWSKTETVEDRQSVVDLWHAETFPPPGQTASAYMRPTRVIDSLADEEILKKARASKQGPKFERVWSGDSSDYGGDASDGDCALCGMLRFWCRDDAAAMDRLFRASGRMRDKWDARRGSQTYGERTIAYVLSQPGAVYDPGYRSEQVGTIGPQPSANGKHDEPPAEDVPVDEDDVAGIADLKRAGAEVRWLWPGWIQRGVLTAIAAEGGTGKTRLTADLVRRIRHGLVWPDGTPVTTHSGRTVALWVVSDNHHDEMVSLCEAFDIVDCVKLNASRSDPYGGVTLDTMTEFVELERRIKAVRPAVVVIDTVGNSTDRNLSKQEDAKAYYQPLQIIARRLSVAILALTHLNTGGKILGRRALEKVRTCIRMSAKQVNQTDCPRRLEVIKSNSKYPPALGVVMGQNGNDYNDAPPPPPEETGTTSEVPTKTQECADWLRTILQRRCAEKVTVLRDDAERAGFSSKVLYAAQKLIKAEEVEQQGRKWWRLKDDAQNSN